jgi:hypothetical protein
MSKSNAAETDVLKLLFQAATWANLADNAASSPAVSLYIALHTADPGEAGTQLTNEATFTSYARKPVTRSSVWWAVASGICNPVFAIDFPQCTGGSNNITYASIGTGVSDYLIYSGPLSPTVSVVSGVVVRLTTATSIIED